MSVILSPHPDDAVLSLGQKLAAGPCKVITVFAGVPPVDFGLSDYDKACGFTSSHQAMTARRAEDRAALETLDSLPQHLDFLDGQYLRVVDDMSAISSEINALLSPTLHVYVPLGLGHPDHRLVSDAALIACAEGELLLYEELPYKVLWPEEVGARLDVFRRSGFTIEPYPAEPGDPTVKRRAVACYASQDLDPSDPCLNVPERVWRAVR